MVFLVIRRKIFVTACYLHWCKRWVWRNCWLASHYRSNISAVNSCCLASDLHNNASVLQFLHAIHYWSSNKELNKGPFESNNNYLMLLSLFKLTTCFGLCTAPSSGQLCILWPEDGRVQRPKHVVSLTKDNDIRYRIFSNPIRTRI